MEKYIPARELEELLFNTDEAELTPEGKKAYDLLSARLKEHKGKSDPLTDRSK